MKVSELQERIYELQMDVVDFMDSLTGQPWDVTIEVDGAEFIIKVYGSLEFVELIFTEWGHYETLVMTDGFDYYDELVKFLDELQV